MSEECKYYYYDKDYCCAVKREKEKDAAVDSDTVHKYCWGYNYEDCPRYKNAESSSSYCFLTSACVASKGLPDDCHELTVLRFFRDNYMASLPDGEKDVKEYYRCAPAIVTNIQSLPNAKEIFDQIYNDLVTPCVKLIEEGKNFEAYTKYKDYTRFLREQYHA